MGNIQDIERRWIMGGIITMEDVEWLLDVAKQAETYETALEFYANPENYEEWDEDSSLTEYIHSVDFDGGDIARNALNGLQVVPNCTNCGENVDMTKKENGTWYCEECED